MLPLYIASIDVVIGKIAQMNRKSTNGTEGKLKPGPRVMASGPNSQIPSTIKRGRPKGRHISTSLVERHNLTIRMQLRRFTRLTNGFSKKFANLKAAVTLYCAHYNFCRVHSAIKKTPAMAAGLTDHPWSIEELLVAGYTSV